MHADLQVVQTDARNGASYRRRVWWMRPGLLALLVISLPCMALLSRVRSDLPVSELLPAYGSGASRFVALEGMNVHYRDEGTGPPRYLGVERRHDFSTRRL